MGIIWRSAMPLLTTLAALVIIVHSAEEDLETEYRHELRNRDIMDKEMPNFDQSWRAMQAGSSVQEQQNTENWEKYPLDDIPKRRRPGRKRKRRPQTDSSEDLIPQERFVYPDEPPLPFFDLDFDNTQTKTTEMPKRRRKKIENKPTRWSDEVVDLERPIRRRGQRRKRPSLQTWPDLSDFREIKTTQDPVEPKTESIDQVNTEDVREEVQQDVVQIYDDKHELTEQRPANMILQLHQLASNDELSLPIEEPEINGQPKKMSMVENESLSAHSPEQVIKTATKKRKSSRNMTEMKVEHTKAQLKVLANNRSETKVGNFQTKSYLRSVRRRREKKKSYEKADESMIIANKIQEPATVETHPRIKKVVNSTTITLVVTKNESKPNISNALERHMVEQEKANEKVKETISAEKIKHLSMETAKMRLQKCKEKLQRHRIRSRSLEESQPILWKHEIFTDGYVMDPLTLKDILKRSNGTSLSEILQQHNLSLTDLLSGKHHAVSIFKSRDSLEDKTRNPLESRNDISEVKQDLHDKASEEQTFINSETNYTTEPAAEYPVPLEIQTEDKIRDDEPTTTIKPEEKTFNISTRLRYPVDGRKKLRMRPMLNNTYKGQLSRDLVAMNSRKYSRHRINIGNSKELRDVIPSMTQNDTYVEKNNTVEDEITTTAIIPEETTITVEITNNNTSSKEINLEDDEYKKLDDINIGITETPVSSIKEVSTEITQPTTEKLKVVSMVRPNISSTGLRRQAFNNRLKRKRLKHKNATTEPPQDDIIKHLFGVGGLVSSSEFIARTQEPKSIEDDANDLTTLDDFITTESTRRTESGPEQSAAGIISTSVTTIPNTTEETAKIEIEEILNDTRTSAKLSKILMERNMTLSELVEHRERGSSHVHLADIFHNASREPNPPEPFLSKSLLEPISKETYPLRALLDANLHDPRVTTDEPSMISNAKIPIVMDFRNNVNENAENMGIMSLFNNITMPSNSTTLMKDSEGRAYKTSIFAVNVANEDNAKEDNAKEDNAKEDNAKEDNANETVRESRLLSESPDDVVSWNEIFSLMGRNHNNDTPRQNREGLPMKSFKTGRLDEDEDGDGLIVLEDLQHLKEFENHIASASDEKIEMKAYENKETTPVSGILGKIPSQTKSVTVATASIAGLAMVLFLITYTAFKWKQQRSVVRKKRSFNDERIPTPVFEHRKGHKNNSSTRSISPMLQTSNIYTLNTLDSQNGKESPDYMWDSLRKPFQ